MGSSDHDGESSRLVEPLVSVLDAKVVISTKDDISTEPPSVVKLNRSWWWLLVTVNVFFVISGQTAALLLGKFYYVQGGYSTFITTIVQTAGFPVLFIPLLTLPSSCRSSVTSNAVSSKQITLIYVCLGILTAIDNLLYSLGFLHLPTSTFALLSSTQLVFNFLFSFFLNSQKLTPPILNSLAVLWFSAALHAVNEGSDSPKGATTLHYAIGFMCALMGAVVYSLLLAMIQLTFQKVLKKETFTVVLEMQIYTSIVATVVITAGFFVTGQWTEFQAELGNFNAGPASYAMTLVWSAVSWQLNSVGVVGLIFLVSSLFSNVISTLALAVTPIASVMIFREEMNGIMIIAMLQALWGSASYIYQNYLDDSRSRRPQGEQQDVALC